MPSYTQRFRLRRQLDRKYIAGKQPPKIISQKEIIGRIAHLGILGGLGFRIQRRAFRAFRISSSRAEERCIRYSSIHSCERDISPHSHARLSAHGPDDDLPTSISIHTKRRKIPDGSSDLIAITGSFRGQFPGPRAFFPGELS